MQAVGVFQTRSPLDAAAGGVGEVFRNQTEKLLAGAPEAGDAPAHAALAGEARAGVPPVEAVALGEAKIILTAQNASKSEKNADFSRPFPSSAPNPLRGSLARPIQKYHKFRGRGRRQKKLPAAAQLVYETRPLG